IITGAGDKIYARGEKPADRVGVFRRSKEFVDPDTGEFLGLEARSIARGDVAAENGEVLTVNLSRSSEEVRIADRLLVNEDRRLTTNLVPSSPDDQIEGKMISVDGGVNQMGRYNVVAIDRGEREGLTPGIVMAVLTSGKLVRAPLTGETMELPSERAGVLRVFQ